MSALLPRAARWAAVAIGLPAGLALAGAVAAELILLAQIGRRMELFAASLGPEAAAGDDV